MCLSINTNLFETNIINLTAVIGFLFFFGKDLLVDALKERRTKILAELDILERRRIDAAKKLSETYLELVLATFDAEIMILETKTQITILSNDARREANKRARRLRETYNGALNLEGQQLMNDVQSRLLRKASETALENLQLYNFMMLVEVQEDFQKMGYPIMYMRRSANPAWNSYYRWRVLDENPWLVCYRLPLTNYKNLLGLRRGVAKARIKKAGTERTTHWTGWDLVPGIAFQNLLDRIDTPLGGYLGFNTYPWRRRVY